MASGTIIKPAVDITERGIEITGSTDLNTITTPGRYFCTDPTNLVNKPITCTNLDLIATTRSWNSRVWQIALCFLSGNSQIYTRVQTSDNSWDAWTRMINTANIHSLNAQYTSISYTDTLSYLGKTIVVPAKSFASFSVNLSWTTGKPAFVSINNSSTGSTSQLACGFQQDPAATVCASLSYMNTSSSAYTFYIWGKCANATGTTTINVNGYYVDL